MKKNRKKVLVAGIVALAVVAGVLAYFSSTMSIDNPFSTKEYGGETVEKFTPKKDWQPGDKVTKEVAAKNTGDYPLFVRVKFNESWTRNGGEIDGTVLDSADGDKFFPASEDSAVKGGSSVYKELPGLDDGSWIDGGDGYYYYKTALAAGSMTTNLLGSVTLCKDADMGSYKSSGVRYALVDKSVKAEDLEDEDYDRTQAPSADEIGPDQVVYQKVTSSLDENNAGLAKADYTLTITTEIIQANSDAANETNWGYIPSK